MTITKQLEYLKTNVAEYLKKVRALKSVHAFSYKSSEQPQKITPNAPPQQFNVVEVRALITHVLTANALGYETILRAEDEQTLRIIFAEKQPIIPFTLQSL